MPNTEIWTARWFKFIVAPKTCDSILDPDDGEIHFVALAKTGKNPGGMRVQNLLLSSPRLHCPKRNRFSTI